MTTSTLMLLSIILNLSILTPFLFICNCFSDPIKWSPGYLDYHESVVNIEELIVQKRFSTALKEYQELFNNYDFVFLRDYQVATQLAWLTGSKGVSFDLLRKSFQSGWEMNDYKKNKLLEPQRNEPEWKHIRKEYKSLRKDFETGIDLQTQRQVKAMLNKDQWRALRAALNMKSGSKKYDKFINHSEKQLAELNSIIEQKGYPGEQLIGNGWWMSVILSHHNSISQEYNSNDSIYPDLRPKLIEAISLGQMYPYQFAVVEDWRVAVTSNREEAAFGYLNPLLSSEIQYSNDLRSQIGMRSVQLRQELVNIEQETGMDLYLSGEPWVDGKIEIVENRKQ